MSKEIHFNPRDFDQVSEIALQFPGTEADLSHYNTPSVKVKGKFLCRLHENGEFIATRMEFKDRENYLEQYPEAFHVPEHYVKYPFICIWIESLKRVPLKEVLEKGWRSLASQKLQAQYDKTRQLST